MHNITLRIVFLIQAFFVLSCPITGFSQTYTSTAANGAWFTDRWNNSTDGPTYTSAYTFNRNVNFTAGSYTFAGMGGAINVGNITVGDGVTVTFTAANSTLQTSGQVRTINVGTGGKIDFSTQGFSAAAGVGFNKTGAGVLALAGNTYTGGFTLNAGTVIMRGVNAMGGGATNVLTLNGGVVGSSDTRTMDNTKYGGGIVIGGNVQFGELDTVVSIASSTANLSFANGVDLGSATRTLTVGNHGVQTFSGVISNTGSAGITFAANSGVLGRFDITNAANTFAGDTTITGGEVRFTSDGSLGNTENDITIDGGRFAKASDSTTVTLGSGRSLFIGDGTGTSISSPGSGTLAYGGAIANKTGETGSWSKQGTGIVELSGVSTYTGETAINSGMIRLTAGANRLPTGTTVSLGQAASVNLGTLNLNGFDQEIAGLNSISGTNAATNNNIVESTAAATLDLGGSGTYSYGDGSNANSGIIRGALAIVKSGSGQQEFGDVNTYTGGTTVSAGSLKVSNTSGSATGTGNVTIGAGSTILGSGIVSPNSGGTVTVESGGRVAAGAIAGTPSEGAKTLTFTPVTGSMVTTFRTGSVMEFDLFNNNGNNYASTTAADLFRTGGSMVIETGVTLRVINASISSFSFGDVWRLLDWSSLAGSVSGDYTQLALDLPVLSAGQTWELNQLFTNGSISVVPEPSRALLLALGLLGLVFRRETGVMKRNRGQRSRGQCTNS